MEFVTPAKAGVQRGKSSLTPLVHTQTVARELDRRLDEIFDLQDRITAGIPGLDDSHRADVQAAERAA